MTLKPAQQGRQHRRGGRRCCGVWVCVCAETIMLSACAESMIALAPPATSMILSAPFDCVITLLSCYGNSGVAGWGQQKNNIGNTDNHQFMTLVNSASTALPIGLAPKMAECCHTSNRLLVGRQSCHALSWLYFNSSASSWSVGHWLVGP